MSKTHKSDWKNGKPFGCIYYYEGQSGDWFNFVFKYKGKHVSKCFNVIHYNNSKEEAKKAAGLYQKMISDNMGMTKNQYRYVYDKHFRVDYLEVKLQNGIIMKCDENHLPIVEERIWTANKSKGKKTYYVKSRESKKRNQQYALFHRLAFPEYEQVDHINGDGLDNRRINIREGKGRINALNKSKLFKNNSSGFKGVFRENGKTPRWCAQWNNIEGKRKKKSFSVFKYGEEQAKQKAIHFRKTEFQKVLQHFKIQNRNKNK